VTINRVEVKVEPRVPLVEVGGGLPGPIGVSIVNAVVNGSGHLILTLSNGDTIDAGYIVGPVGPVSGPVTSTDGHLVLWDGSGGNIIKNSIYTPASFATAAQGATADSALQSITETGNGININTAVPTAPVLSLDATLEAVANFATSADTAMYWTGTDTLGSYATTVFSRSFMGAVDAAAGRTALLLGNVAVLTTGTSAGNVPVLDGSGLLDTAVLPSIAITDTFVVANQAAMLALTAQKGDVAVRSDLNKSFILSTNSPSTLADWKELLTPTDAVLSVAGLTGAISGAALLTAIGLATSDSPQFAGINLGHATDTTLTRLSAGQAAVEGVQVLTASNAVVTSNKLFEDSTNSFVDAADNTKRVQIAADLVDASTTRVLTSPNKSGVIVLDPTAVTDIPPTLDFGLTTTDGALFDDYFARTGGGGYRLNSKGVLVPTVDREPMIDFGSDGKPRGTGFYGAYTNLILRSEELDNAAWTKARATVTANAISAPDGVVTADKIVEDATASNTHFAEITYAAATASTVYTFSVFAKAAERSELVLSVYNGSTTPSCRFNLSTGIASTPANGAIAIIENMGGGWYRCSITFTMATTSTAFCDIYLHNGTSSTYTGDGTSGLYAWGAQLTATAFPVPYVPTTSAAVARAADSMIVSGTDFTGFFNPVEGTFFADYYNIGVPAAIAPIAIFTRNTGAFGPRIQIALGTTGLPALSVFDDTSTAICSVTAASSAWTGMVACSFTTNNYNLASNGVLATPDTSGIMPTGLLGLELGRSPPGTHNLNGNIRRLIYWPKALSATELVRMTA
jgi:hypothetical protein